MGEDICHPNTVQRTLIQNEYITDNTNGQKTFGKRSLLLEFKKTQVKTKYCFSFITLTQIKRANNQTKGRPEEKSR